jgi:asparagine synthase (glutamine-hydrolysing)
LKQLSDVEAMMAQDTSSYLVDDILVKLDRAAMSVSLETRVPLLDHNVLEFAWSLPLSLKIKNGISKWPLRQLLYKYVPKEMIERPKAGFAVPIDEWLRGPLKEWASDLLNEKHIQQQGFLNARLVQELWQEHLSNKRNCAAQLWSVLMFQAWLAQQGNIR